MEISLLNMHFWRYSLNKIANYPFYKYSNRLDIYDLTLQCLKEEETSIWLDTLLKRNKGYHENIKERNNTSKLRRKLDYISQILISTVIKNDIGVHGAISPIFTNCISQNECFNSVFYVPSNVKFIHLSNEYKFQNLIKERKSVNEYLIPYSTDPNRFSITDYQTKEIIRISKDFINFLFKGNKIELSTDCCFFAIDYFVLGNVILPLEWHFPGRGIGLHFTPFIHNNISVKQAISCLDTLRNDLKLYYHSNINLIYENGHSTDFHFLDNSFVNFINCANSSLLNKSIKLDVNDNISEFHERQFKTYNKPRHFIVNKELKNLDIFKLKNCLGDWIVLKSNLNIPWWSNNRLRPEILLVDKQLIHRVNYLLKKNSSLLLQELVTESIDNYGHFGELRFYFLLMN
jgi:hypothetical protein